ncbi:MAG: hypothetical protein LUG99_14505 [Lachnospiraceae bacterium]|nr:hypothetical protein [Lachnospiraceae bacterium]
MKTLYMHLGTPKTATSSIQVACEKNDALFHEYGYSFPLFPYRYPGVRTQRNGHFLIEASVEHDTIPNQDTTWQDRLALGFNMVHEEFKKYDNVILTDESFWRSINYNKQSPLALLKKDAADFGYTIKIIVYLRRQDNYLISRWNQFVKEGTMVISLPDHLEWMLAHEPLVTDYAAALDRLASQVGRENIIVRRFEPSSWVGGSIYADFADAIGLPAGISLQPPDQDVNPGLKGNAVELQLMVNRMSALSLEEKMSYSTFAKSISAKMPEEDQYNALSPKETEDFLAHFKEGNDRVVREYLKDNRPLFSSQVKNVPKWERENAYFRDDVEAFFNAMPDDKKIDFLTAAVYDLQAKGCSLAENKRYIKIGKKYANTFARIKKIQGVLAHPLQSLKGI